MPKTTKLTNTSTPKPAKVTKAKASKKTPKIVVDDGSEKFVLEQNSEAKKGGATYVSKKYLRRLTPLNFYKLRVYEHAQRRVWNLKVPVPKEKTPWVEVEVRDGHKKNKHSVQVFSVVGDFPPMVCDCEDYWMTRSGACLHTSAVLRLIEEKPVAQSTTFKKLPESIEDVDGVVGHFNPVAWQYTNFGGSLLSEQEKRNPANSYMTHTHYAHASYLMVNPTDSIKDEFDDNLKRILETKPYHKGLLGPNLDLYPYQQEVFHKMLAAKRSICSMTMGSGKSLTTTACYGWILKHVDPKATMLVVGPKSLLSQWKREIDRSVGTWSPVKVTVLDKPKLLDKWCAGDASLGQVGIINYQMASRHVAKVSGRRYTAVVVDEVQFARNNETKLWEALKALQSDYMFTLSGTVVENKLADLYSVMQLIDPNALGPLWKFEADYHEINNITRTKILLGQTKNMDVLRTKLEQRLFTYTALKLPSMKYTTIRVTNDKMEQELTDAYLADAKLLIAQSLSKPLTIGQQAMLQAYLLKARQACCTSQLVNKQSNNSHRPKKLEQFRRVVEDVCVTRGKKLVVFSEWTEMINILRQETDDLGLTSVLYTGNQNVKARDSAVTKFQIDPNCKVFFASDAGGVGLDGLQFAASAVLHFELPWNPAKLDQRTGRVYRLGQLNPCECYYLVAKSCIEEGIETVLGTKRAIRAEVMQTGAKVATEADTITSRPTVSALKQAIDASSGHGVSQEEITIDTVVVE